MAEFEDKLNAILSNPDAMSQIVSFAQSLEYASGGDSMASEEAKAPTSADCADSDAKKQADSGNGSAPFADFSGNLDPKLLGILAKLTQDFSCSGEGKNTALLATLRPFLTESRQSKLDEAIKLASVSQTVWLALTLLKGGDEAV